LGQFKLQLALVLFLVIGAHRAFLSSLLESFALIPALGFPRLAPGWTSLAADIASFSGQMLAAGVQLAAPVMIALLLTELFFGIVNRAAPQINVFFLSMPVKVALGLLVVLFALSLYSDRYIYYFKESIRAFDYLLRVAGAN
jgi:flagellar biosynthetic protein FliR